MRTHLPTTVLPLALVLAMLSSGCLWLAPYMVPYALLPTGRKPNADVASWPEYTMMVDGTFLTFPLHPTADGKPLHVPEREGEMMVFDKSWLDNEDRSFVLGEGKFEWDSRIGLPRFDLAIFLFELDLGASDNAHLERLESSMRSTAERTRAPFEFTRMRTEAGEWLVGRFMARESNQLTTETYHLALSDNRFLCLRALYRPVQGSVPEKWYAERRAILRQAVERVRVSDLPPQPKDRP